MAASFASLHHLLDKSFSALRVGVATVHEAVHKRLVFQSIRLAHFYQFEQMFEAGVHAAVAAKPHQMEFLALLFGVGVGSFHLRILHDRVILTCPIDFHQVLIDDASCTDIEMSHLRISHLSVGQPHIFAACLQLTVCRHCREIIQIGCRGIKNHVTLILFSDSPTIENHE